MTWHTKMGNGSGVRWRICSFWASRSSSSSSSWCSSRLSWLMMALADEGGICWVASYSHYRADATSSNTNGTHQESRRLAPQKSANIGQEKAGRSNPDVAAATAPHRQRLPLLPCK